MLSFQIKYLYISYFYIFGNRFSFCVCSMSHSGCANPCSSLIRCKNQLIMGHFHLGFFLNWGFCCLYRIRLTSEMEPKTYVYTLSKQGHKMKHTNGSCTYKSISIQAIFIFLLCRKLYSSKIFNLFPLRPNRKCIDHLAVYCKQW